MNAILGKVDNGRVTLSEITDWSEGQLVLVMPLSHKLVFDNVSSPPIELLEEDAAEFRRRPETLMAVNRRDLT